MRHTQWVFCLAALHGLSPAFAGDAPQPLEMNEIAHGIFVHLGAQAEANRVNRGDIANVGFIAGEDCVAVVDTGGTPEIGTKLRAVVAAHTNTSVCYVINTHMHPDHVLGNKAFVDTDAEFIAAAGFDRALAARSTSYLERMPDTIGIHADMSWIVMPDRMIEEATTLDLGGREITLQAWSTAHTNNDLTVRDSQTHTLWSGDLLFVDRVPSIDGSIVGWLGVLDRLAGEAPVETVVPGHGPVNHDINAAVAPERRYLETVRDDVREAIDAGYGLKHTASHAARAERDRWLLFDDYHPRNVTAAYTELEWE